MKLIAVGNSLAAEIRDEMLKRPLWAESVVLEESEESLILRRVEEIGREEGK